MSARLQWARDGADWPLREHSLFIDAGGMRWHVQRLGKGPVLLLLHGTGASAHSWRDLAPLLAARYTLVAPDLPGHAFTDPLNGGRPTLPRMAAAVAALLGASPLAQPVHAVLGHSAGAAIMLQLALDGALPDAALIGLNAALLPFEGAAAFIYPPMARLLALNPLVPWLASWRAQDIATVRRLIASTGSRLDDTGIAHYARLIRSPGHVAGALSMMAHWDLNALQRSLPGLGRTLHLLVAEHDGTVPPSEADAVAARVPRVQVHRLPGYGHLVHEEAPQQVVDRLLPLLHRTTVSQI
jgi:magnesium chelatase accessory protein